jgi:hypothetical protein
MRRDVEATIGEVKWQDRIINAVGWVFGWIMRILTYPLVLIGRGIEWLLPKRVAKPKARSYRWTRNVGGVLRGIAMALLIVQVAVRVLRFLPDTLEDSAIDPHAAKAD